MDITQTELKAMKAKQLRRIIREAIEEILTEDAAKVKNLKLKATQLRQQAIDAEQAASTEEERDLQQDKTAMAEAEIECGHHSRRYRPFQRGDPVFLFPSRH